MRQTFRQEKRFLHFPPALCLNAASKRSGPASSSSEEISWVTEWAVPLPALPQYVPGLSISFPHRSPAHNIGIQPQAPCPPYLFNRNQIPGIRRLHVRRDDINIFFRIPLLPVPPRRMHGLHLISTKMQPPRPLHLHAIRPTILPPDYEVVPLAVPHGNARWKPFISAFNKNAACEISPSRFGFPRSRSQYFSCGSATAKIHGITHPCVPLS